MNEAETRAEYIDPKLKVNFVESPIMNQLSYDVKADKFEAKGFRPKGDLEQGISQTIKKLKAITVSG